MPSFRERLLNLALDGNSRKLQSQMQDAASICKTKEAAMAFGYLLGKEDAGKQEPSIYDSISSLFEQVDNGFLDSVDAVDLCFGLIYEWLDKVYEDEDYDPPTDPYAGARFYLAKAFRPLTKPGVIPPLNDEESEK